MGETHLAFVSAVCIDEYYLLGDSFGQNFRQRGENVVQLSGDACLPSILNDTNTVDTSLADHCLLDLFDVNFVSFQASIVAKPCRINNGERRVTDLDYIFDNIICLRSHSAPFLVLNINFVNTFESSNVLNAAECVQNT